MTPSHLLDLANRVLSRPDVSLKSAWPRAAALLGRQALEEGMDLYWDSELPNMKDASRRTQTLCLQYFVRDEDLADGIKEAWASLTRACHHHPYELSPTASELEIWLDDVAQLVSRLSGEPQTV